MAATSINDDTRAYGREAPFWEAALLQQYTPRTPDVNLGDYVHHYERVESQDQLLSTQFRELIATLMLAVVGHQRFAARHIRRLYRLGVTSQVIVDVFWAASPFIGRAHVLTGIRCIHLANDASNLEGTLPPGGAPTSLTDFAELHLSNTGPGSRILADTPEWQLVTQIDPRLAELTLEFYEEVMGGSRSWTLPVAARELIAIVCLAWRGMVDLTADHVRVALACGVDLRQVLEALSAAVPMTGLVTLQVGARAMILAQSMDIAHSGSQ
jgi:alkylhydroperoxidase/carboxymuconolactone decarboxylase family protein YurZ